MKAKSTAAVNVVLSGTKTTFELVSP